MSADNVLRSEAALQPNLPVAVDDFYTVHGSLLLTPMQNDTDQNSIIFDSLGSQPQHGTLVAPRLGEYVYTPDGGYLGPDSFTYTIRDIFGNRSTGTVNINVVNQAPVANTDFYTVHASLLLTPMQNDTDPDGDSVIFDSLATQPQHGTLVAPRLGEYVYTPNGGYVGADSFTYIVRDNLWAYSSGTVEINVINQSPIANTDSYTVHGSLLLTPMQNDTDPDGEARSKLRK